MSEDLGRLADRLIIENLSMVSRERFETIIRLRDSIAEKPGVIVECGCWRGGMSAFLANAFPEKDIWIYDSFAGFQPQDQGSYTYDKERHVPGALAGVGMEVVESTIRSTGVEPSGRVHLVKGWVRDSLSSVPYDQIALLRVDVDAYSATREVLDALWDRVAPGGVVVFDDSSLIESVYAMHDFFEARGAHPAYRHPETDEPHALRVGDFENPPGVYAIK